jgi:hypothetical protein
MGRVAVRFQHVDKHFVSITKQKSCTGHFINVEVLFIGALKSHLSRVRFFLSPKTNQSLAISKNTILDPLSLYWISNM